MSLQPESIYPGRVIVEPHLGNPQCFGHVKVTRFNPPAPEAWQEAVSSDRSSACCEPCASCIMSGIAIGGRSQGDFRAFLAVEGGFGTVGVEHGKPFVEVVSGTIDVGRIEFST